MKTNFKNLSGLHFKCLSNPIDLFSSSTFILKASFDFFLCNYWELFFHKSLRIFIFIWNFLTFFYWPGQEIMFYFVYRYFLQIKCMFPNRWFKYTDNWYHLLNFYATTNTEQKSYKDEFYHRKTIKKGTENLKKDQASQ